MRAPSLADSPLWLPRASRFPAPIRISRCASRCPCPTTLPANSETAAFVYGSCFHRRLRVRGLEVQAGRDATPATHGMPRADLHAALHQFDVARPGSGDEIVDDPNDHSYRSGFWAIAPLRMPPSGAVEIVLAVELSDGSSQQVRLGEVRVALARGAR